MALLDFGSIQFRSNTAYELIQFDRLEPAEREQLRAITEQPDNYGILRANRGAAVRIKAVCRETALLFLTLRNPAPLPSYLHSVLGDDFDSTIRRLVMDEILEFEYEGRFLCGTEAFALLANSQNGQAPLTGTAKLSRDALLYAEALEISNSFDLCTRLYFFNREPASAQRRRLFSNKAAHLFLRLKDANLTLEHLDGNWNRLNSENGSKGWIAWHSRQSTVVRSSGLTHKLYISPKFDALPEAFPIVVRALSKVGAPHFKLGDDLYGLLRPDKLVVYFENRQHLQEAAQELRLALEGCLAQGVPFSAPVDDEGLLSWGMDPPASEWSFGSSESWRLWIASRLAASLVATKLTADSSVRPVDFALERVRLEGIDTDSWIPSTRLWKQNADIRGNGHVDN